MRPDSAASSTGRQGGTVWLASYPKSGNTWMRAILTGLSVHPLLFRANRLSSGHQPHHVGSAAAKFGIDQRWLDASDLDRLRTTLIGFDSPDTDPPALRKTHEHHRLGQPERPGSDPFPVHDTRAAIFIVRDPRDVAPSFASHFGTTIDRAIDALADERSGDQRSSPFHGFTTQPWGSWSTHAASWLDPAVPFPVHLVRYEDLQTDPIATLSPVFADIGLACTDDQLTTAVEQARFDRLRDQEADSGFREVSRKADRFFRRGISGGWRDDLTPKQVAAIEADHLEMMIRLGYEPISDETTRAAVAEARASTRRRRALRKRIAIAPEAGLEVEFGEVPDTLDGGRDVADHFHTTDTATIARIGPNLRILVEDGTRVTVDWPDDVPDGPNDTGDGSTGSDRSTDQSWIVQGWAVVIAGLQRGNLSIHASTVRIGDETVAIAGHRGAGKSTTSMGLRARGHQLLVDDTTMLEFRDGIPYVVPYARNVHLLPDAAEALGVDFDTLDLLGGGRRKAAFLPEPPDPTPQRLDRIVILRRRRELDRPTIVDLGSERVAAIAEHAERRGLTAAILGDQHCFEQVVQLAAGVRAQVLYRPLDDWTLDAVLDLIEQGSSR